MQKISKTGNQYSEILNETITRFSAFGVPDTRLLSGLELKKHQLSAMKELPRIINEIQQGNLNFLKEVWNSDWFTYDLPEEGNNQVKEAILKRKLDLKILDKVAQITGPKSQDEFGVTVSQKDVLIKNISDILKENLSPKVKQALTTAGFDLSNIFVEINDLDEDNIGIMYRGPRFHAALMGSKYTILQNALAKYGVKTIGHWDWSDSN